MRTRREHPDTFRGSPLSQAQPQPPHSRKALPSIHFSEDPYRVLYEDIPAMYFTLDRHGTVLSVNRFGAEQLGYAAGELTGRSVLTVFHEDDRPSAQRQLTLLLEQPGQARRWQLRTIRKDGTVMWVEEDARAIRLDDGTMIVLVVCSDISDHKRAETALLESEERYRLLVNQATDIMYRIDPRGYFTFVNPTSTRLMGYAESELLGHHFTEFVRPDYRAKAARFYWRQLRHRTTTTYFEFPALTKDGREIWFGQNVQLLEEAGRITGLFSVTRDITERKRAEEITRKSRDYYLKLLDEFPSPIWKSGPDAKCDYFNKSWLAFTGRALEQERGDGWAEGVHPDDLDRCVTTYLAAFHARKPFEMEYRLRRHDGEYRSIVDIGRPYYDLDGNFAGYLGSVYDITERKRAEQALAASEHHLKTILETEPECVKVVTEDCVLLDMNPAGLKMVEADRLEEIGGRSVLPLIAPAYRDAFADFTRRVHAGRPGVMEFEIVGLKGGRRWVETHAVPLRDECNETAGVLAVTRDISRRKQAEESLRRSEAFLSLLIEHLPNMVFVKDAQSLRFVRFNKAGEDLLGFSRTELIGKNDYDFFPPEQADFFTARDREVLSGGRLLDIPEEPIQTKSKGLRILHTKKIPLSDEAGTPQFLLGISEDITGRKQTEEALHAARQEREQLARNLHDNIIQSIYAIGFTLEECQALLKDVPVNANRKLDQVIVELNRIIREVRSYLVTPEKESESLSADELIASLQRLGGLMEHANGMRFTFTIDRAAVDRLTAGQRAQFLYVAQEAMSNSLRHSGAPAAHISLASTPGGIRLEIRDGGVGFTLQEIRNGSGGLKNIRVRARKIGANLEIMSRPMKGTVICMEIPANGHYDSP